MYCVYEKEDIVVHEIGVVVLCIVIVVYNVYATTLSAVSIEKSFLCLLTKKKKFFFCFFVHIEESYNERYHSIHPRTKYTNINIKDIDTRKLNEVKSND